MLLRKWVYGFSSAKYLWRRKQKKMKILNWVLLFVVKFEKIRRQNDQGRLVVLVLKSSADSLAKMLKSACFTYISQQVMLWVNWEFVILSTLVAETILALFRHPVYWFAAYSSVSDTQSFFLLNWNLKLVLTAKCS